MPDDGSYEGEYKDGEWHGFGVYSWPSGKRYEGQFESGQFHGLGIQTFPSAKVYEGEFVRGRRQGHGVISLETGDTYRGTWHWNDEHGHGIHRWVSGRPWLDGRTYTGEYKLGTRRGCAVRTAADGSVREGQWRGDVEVDFCTSAGCCDVEADRAREDAAMADQRAEAARRLVASPADVRLLEAVTQAGVSESTTVLLANDSMLNVTSEGNSPLLSARGEDL